MLTWLFNQFEPARLRATIVAALSLAASLGIVNTADVPSWVDAVLPVIAVLFPLLQQRLIRPVVTPTAKVEAALEAAPIPRQARADLQAQLVDGTEPVPEPVTVQGEDL